MPADPPNKKSALRRNFDLLLVLLIFVPVYYAHAVTQPVSPFLPREEPVAHYQRHVQLSFHFPFVSSYFLMVPQNYDPERYSYPLVLMLHGVSRHMYGGKVLAYPEMRDAFPFFVLIPIAPYGLTWAQPERFTLRPQAIGGAMAALRGVTGRYRINPDQVYVTGYSMGGLGVYGAITRYKNVFAAAVPISAWWHPETVGEFDDLPLWIIHGARDADIPVEAGRAVADALKEIGREVYYTEYPNTGHAAWVPAYDDPEFWHWLLQQRKR
jgi:predicted peptidase